MMGLFLFICCFLVRLFLYSGVDYVGLINIRIIKGRGYKLYKGYICLFVCMFICVFYFEVVSDMII